MNILLTVFCFVGIAGIAFVLAKLFDDGSDHCIDWHRRNGRYRVQYPDDQISQPFTLRVAKDYAEMFGGKVIKE